MAWVLDLRADLLARREALERRMGRIGSDRRRVAAPPEADSEERAVQRENDEVLDALDLSGRDELASIDAAVARIDDGRFGICARCGGAIGEARLRALPTASLCVACSDET